jgi:ABC-type amino acid transport system permease subunit
MDARGMVPQDRQDPGATRGLAKSRVDWAALFATLSLVALVVQAMAVIILLTSDHLSDKLIGDTAIGWALYCLAVALAIAAAILGLIGKAAASPHSRVRALCTIEAVLGVPGLVGILVGTYLAITVVPDRLMDVTAPSVLRAPPPTA